MATLTKMELFKAMNDKHTNLRDCEGLVIQPVAFHTHQYSDADGKMHSVLVIKNGKDGMMYKTEVAAFIEKFMKYVEAFDEEPDEVAISLDCEVESAYTLSRMAGDAEAENSLDAPDNVKDEAFSLNNAAKEFAFTAVPLSVNVLRLQKR